MRNELRHHGVKGMKWGVRKDRKNNSIKVNTGNLDKFGKNGHNILYITGISGSGKSTLALKLAKELNAEPIHLDHYYDGRSNESSSFRKYLEQNGVNLKNIYNKDGSVNYNISDKIYPLLQQYSKSKKVIVEGVQLLDQTMAENIQDDLKKQPVISVNISARVAYNRAQERDQCSKKLQEIFDDNLKLQIGRAYTDSIVEELKKVKISSK